MEELLNLTVEDFKTEPDSNGETTCDGCFIWDNDDPDCQQGLGGQLQTYFGDCGRNNHIYKLK